MQIDLKEEQAQPGRRRNSSGYVYPRTPDINGTPRNSSLPSRLPDQGYATYQQDFQLVL